MTPGQWVGSGSVPGVMSGCRADGVGLNLIGPILLCIGAGLHLIGAILFFDRAGLNTHPLTHSQMRIYDPILDAN